MVTIINNPASFAVHSVICFLNAKDRNAAKIYCELCEIYGPIVGLKENLA